VTHPAPRPAANVKPGILLAELLDTAWSAARPAALGVAQELAPSEWNVIMTQHASLPRTIHRQR
jgi:hypothetical protein